MYDGEYVGLKKILETGIVTVPKPMKVSDSYCTIHDTFKNCVRCYQDPMERGGCSLWSILICNHLACTWDDLENN